MKTYWLRFEVLTAVKMSIVVFRVVTPCALAGAYHKIHNPVNSQFLINRRESRAERLKLTYVHIFFSDGNSGNYINWITVRCRLLYLI
jgi:hypothetical protein